MSSEQEEKPKAQDNGADAGADLTVFVEQLLGDMVSAWRPREVTAMPHINGMKLRHWTLGSFKITSLFISPYCTQQQKFQQMSDQIIGRHILVHALTDCARVCVCVCCVCECVCVCPHVCLTCAYIHVCACVCSVHLYV